MLKNVWLQPELLSWLMDFVSLIVCFQKNKQEQSNINKTLFSRKENCNIFTCFRRLTFIEIMLTILEKIDNHIFGRKFHKTSAAIVTQSATNSL